MILVTLLTFIPRASFFTIQNISDSGITLTSIGIGFGVPQGSFRVPLLFRSFILCFVV